MSELIRKFGPLPRYVKSYFAIQIQSYNVREIAEHFGCTLSPNAFDLLKLGDDPVIKYDHSAEPSIYGKYGDYIVYEDGRLKIYNQEDFHKIFKPQKD